MSSLLPFNLDSQTSPAVLWGWAIGTLLLASALGFLAGATYANRSADRGFRKSLRAISSLYALALDSLDKRSTFRPCWRAFQGPS